MKTYLVTGGAGFIGSNFVLYMLQKQRDIRIVNVDKLTYAGNLENLKGIEGDDRHLFVQADICDAQAMAGLFARHEPDYVVNFAAESHVDRSITDPGVFAQTNVMGTVTLLNAARAAWQRGEDDFGAHKFLQVSTDEVYGSLPLDDPEAFFRENTPLAPHSPYSASKAAADLFVSAYGDTYRLPVNITRCSNNYGPFQFPEKLIPLMVNNAVQHKGLPVYGDGKNVRDWLYVEDHCKAIDLVIDGGVPGEVYNIGGHNEHPNIFIVKSVISQVSAATGDSAINEGLIEYVADRKGHDRRYGIAPDKIKADLGWCPETPFESGIVRTIRWYLDNEEWVARVTSGAYQDYYRDMYEGRTQEACS
ncbi:MAG: dTDP-glucose 4,6-dehydratase [Eggerthellaceae bacterium]|jgi:dTDP-glucose 4,6-dehydratase|nr:dTDP-glucose 4,6-dehydratase [Eggerthellaceae bacterium]MDR2715746.1 dTDP-glucose 4,6-dehydratase [Coriobacteriaceae bacterium]